MPLLFVYGELRSGQVGHGQLGAALCLGDAWTAPGYGLEETGDEGQGLTPTGQAGQVKGELYVVTDRELRALDRYEDPDFQVGEVELSDGRAAKAFVVGEKRRPFPG